MTAYLRLACMLYFFEINVFVFLARTGRRLDRFPFHIPQCVCVSFLTPIMSQFFFVFRCSRCHEYVFHAFLLFVTPLDFENDFTSVGETVRSRASSSCTNRLVCSTPCCADHGLSLECEATVRN